METIHAIIMMLGTALPLIGTALAFMSKFIKSAKAKKAAEDYIKLNTAIEEFMIKAENFLSYNGEEKKNYVLRCIKNFALSCGIKYYEPEAGKTVEKLISFSKSINQTTNKGTISLHSQNTGSSINNKGEKNNEQ